MTNSCYLCGRDANLSLSLKPTFTGHNLAKCPESSFICPFCDSWINLRCWYFNPVKEKWNKLFSRNWSSLFVDDKLVSPIIQGTRTEGKDTLPIVSELPTRERIKDWLVNPPQGAFKICIAESGQKHIVPQAETGYNKDFFPVQFELDSIWINRQQIIELLSVYETLLAWFNKAEINSGNYQSERLIKCWQQTSQESWQQLETTLATVRGSRLLELISYVAIKSD